MQRILIDIWRVKFLTIAGKATVIKSVLQAIPIYVKRIQRILVDICRKADSMIKSFLWNGQHEKEKYLALMKWEMLCLPKGKGGLGFKKFEDINRALVTKMGWKRP